MRWTDFAASLSPGDYSRLINMFTVARGYAYLAARAASRDADTSAVIRYLDDSIEHLRLLQRQLAGDPPAMSTSPARARHGSQAAGWRAFLATRNPEDAARLSAALADALIHARRTAEVIHEDGEVEWARRRLDTLLAVLQLARHLCELLVTV